MTNVVGSSDWRGGYEQFRKRQRCSLSIDATKIFSALQYSHRERKILGGVGDQQVLDVDEISRDETTLEPNKPSSFVRAFGNPSQNARFWWHTNVNWGGRHQPYFG